MTVLEYDPIALDRSVEQAIAEQIDAIRVERGVQARITLVAGYWEIGQALASHPCYGAETIRAIIPYLESDLSESSLYKAHQFYQQNADLDCNALQSLEDAVLERFGKGISWSRVCRQLANPDEPESEKAISPKDRRWAAVERALKLSEQRVDETWTATDHRDLGVFLGEIA